MLIDEKTLFIHNNSPWIFVNQQNLCLIQLNEKTWLGFIGWPLSTYTAYLYLCSYAARFVMHTVAYFKENNLHL